MRRCALSEVVPHATRHQGVHLEHFDEELLRRRKVDFLGQPFGIDVRHGLPDQRPLRGRMQLGSR